MLLGPAVRALGLAVLGCLAGLVIERAVQDHQPAPPHVVASRVPAPPAGKRIQLPASPALPEEPQAVRRVLNVSGPMRFGSFVWDEDGAADGQIWIRVDLADQVMSVFRGGDEIGTAVILYGADGRETPRGHFPILEKDADHYSRTYDAPMPFMLRLTKDGVAIHGSTVLQGWATHGCIGVPLDFARRLFAAANKGDLVIILPLQDAKSRLIKFETNRKIDVR